MPSRSTNWISLTPYRSAINPPHRHDAVARALLESLQGLRHRHRWTSTSRWRQANRRSC